MMVYFKQIAAFALLGLALAGCAKDRVTGGAPGVTLSTLAELPQPTALQPYLVGAQQQLEIMVTDSERLSGTYLVDSEGYISFPLVGDLVVSGKTPNQVGRMIENRLRGEFIINPQVRVRPLEVPVPAVSIGGEVERPGTYPAATSQTLVRAVNNAGGLSDFAKVDDVLIMRTVEGQKYIGVYNLEAIQRGNYADPVIVPGDVITVGDSPSRRNLQNILQFIPLLSTSIVLLDQVIN